MEGSLQGPRPLHIKGKATFEILWWDISIRVDKTLVSGEKPPLPAPISVLPLLREALKNLGNWESKLPGGQQQAVTLRSRPEATTEVILHPLGKLTVKENVVLKPKNVRPPHGARTTTRTRLNHRQGRGLSELLQHDPARAVVARG